MKNKDQQILEEAYGQIKLNEGFVDWLQSLMASDVTTLWGAFKVYVGSSLYKELVHFGLDMISILVVGLLVIGTMAKDKLVEVFQSLLKSAKGKKIKELVEKHQQNPEVIELIKILRSAKEDPSKEGIAKRKEAAQKLNQIIQADLDSLHSASPDIAKSVQKGTFDTLKQSTKLS